MKICKVIEYAKKASTGIEIRRDFDFSLQMIALTVISI